MEGAITGIHQSPFRGHSLEFAQHREYAYGDELRHIDWKVYGRTDRFYVKQYQEETNLRAYILLDISKSMTFTGDTGSISKLVYGIHLSAAISYLLLHQEDSVGLALFDNKIRNFIPPRAQLGHFANIADVLENITPGEDTNISVILDDFGKLLKKRGLVIFISDLFDDPEQVMKSIKLLRFKHHDVVVFQIISPYEKELLYKGTALFESLEQPDLQLRTEIEHISREYNRIFHDFLVEYKSRFRQSGIDYCLLETTTPVEIGLGAFLGKRNKQI